MSSQTKLIKDILSLYDTILENKEVDETAETLRSTLGELGYSEKGSELTSGGSVNNKLTDIVTNILKQYKQSNPNVKIVISAGNDKFHQDLNYVSQHTQGNAIDLTLNPYNSTNASAFIRILDDTKKTVPGFDYIDEYTHPSKAATAGHYHLQFGGGATTSNDNKSDSNNTSNTKTQTTTNSNGNYSSSTSYSDAAAEDASFGKELGGKLLNAMGLKESKVYSSFGNKTKDKYGEIIIPNEHNKKIKSAVKGTVVNFKYLPDCKNTIAIEFEKNGKSNYLVYCGISSPTVRKNQTVSDGTVLGTTESDVTVTVYDSDKMKYKINSDEEIKGNNKNKEEDIEKYKDSIYKPSDNEYTKLIKYAYNKIKTGKDIDIASGHFKKKPTDKKITENIERIKGLLK
jgi:hypothetical protein